MSLLRHSVLACLAVLASGCVSLLPETAPPKPRYGILPAETASLEGAPLPWSLVIEDPTATRVYDNVRIAVAPAPGKIEYYGGAEWADRAPRLFQRALTQTFEDAGRIVAVGDRRAVPIGDFVLQTDIRRIHYDVSNGNGRAVASVYARLSDGKGRVYAARAFNADAPVRRNNPEEVVAAFNVAFAAMIPDLVAWTYDQGAAAHDAG
ncbi:MAG: ABC-type transport auxiliary lipoprotein family protein [Hyphococcus sp.]